MTNLKTSRGCYLKREMELVKVCERKKYVEQTILFADQILKIKKTPPVETKKMSIFFQQNVETDNLQSEEDTLGLELRVFRNIFFFAFSLKIHRLKMQ